MYAYYHKRSDDSAPRLDDDDITVEVMVIHYLKDGKKKNMTFRRLSSPFVSRAMFFQLLVYRNQIDRYPTYTLVKIQ